MKPTRNSFLASTLGKTSFVFFATICSAIISHADTIARLNNTSTLDTAGAWSTTTVPTGADIAQWTSAVTGTAATVGLAGNVTFGELLMQNTTLINIGAGGGTLTLNGVGGVGIDITSTANLTITAPLALGGDQKWNVGSGRTLTVAGATGFAQGASNVTLNGLGTTLFSPVTGTAASTSAGSITVNAGILQLNAATTSPTSSRSTTPWPSSATPSSSSEVTTPT